MPERDPPGLAEDQAAPGFDFEAPSDVAVLDSPAPPAVAETPPVNVNPPRPALSAVRGPRLEETLDSDRFFNACQIEERVSIPASLVLAALAANELGNQMRREDNQIAIRGDDVCRWIHKSGTPFLITDFANREWLTADPGRCYGDTRSTPVDELPIGLADVVEGNGWYDGPQLEQIAGVSIREFEAALKAGKIGIDSRRNPSGHEAAPGRNVLAWIARDGIQFTIDKGVEARARAKRSEVYRAAHPVPIAPPVTLAQALNKKLVNEQLEAAELAKVSRQRDFAKLIELASYEGAATPEMVCDLQSVLDGLGLHIGRFNEFQTVLRQASKAQLDRANKPAAQATYVAARDAFNEMIKRHEVELNAAEDVKRKADMRSRVCSNAADELRNLQRRYPDFFDDNQQAPSLITFSD